MPEQKSENGFLWMIKLWPVGLAIIGVVGGYATLQAKVMSLDTVSKDTTKAVATHEVRFAEFSTEQRFIKESVEKIDAKTDKIYDAIQKLKR